jgi:hypothetical protein
MDVYVLKELADCWNECPKPAVTVAAASSLSEEMVARVDREFLQMIGVRFS